VSTERYSAEERRGSRSAFELSVVAYDRCYAAAAGSMTGRKFVLWLYYRILVKNMLLPRRWKEPGRKATVRKCVS
jgi:hypothetical protein